MIDTGRGVAAVVLATVIGVLTGCGGPTPATTADSRSTIAVVPSLHKRLPEDIRRAGVVRVGTDASYAPASFFAKDGRTIIGFEPDLAAALGRVLDVEFRFVNINFTDAIPKVTHHKIDMAISAMTDTPEREQQVDFVNYFAAGTSILVQRGNPAGVIELRDLCGKKVAVEEGTTQVDLLDRTQQGCAQPVQVATYGTNSDALLQLRTGRAVAVLNDYPPAAYLVTEPRTRAHFQLASDTQYEPGLYGVAVAKDETKLRDVLVDALNVLMRSGAYADVLDRWDVTEGAVRSAAVNAGGLGSGE